MATLYIDLGNSRTKFALKKRKYIDVIHVMPNAKWEDPDCLFFLEPLDAKIKVVYITSVAPKALESKVNKSLMEVLHLLPTYLQVQETCCGIKTNYQPFYSLGIDRWLSVLGAYHLYESDLTVIDLGTAITSDTLVNKVHLGGFIAPGLLLQQQSIIEHTGIELDVPIEFKKEMDSDTFFSTDTASAILAGSHLMTVAYLNHLMNEIVHHFDQASHLFVLSGGDAPTIHKMLAFETVTEENLVFEGMDYLISQL